MKRAIAQTGYWWWLGWLWCAAILVLALVPAPETHGIYYSDKFLHAAAFACLAGWFGALLKRSRWWLAVLGLVLFGIAIEGLQSLVGRDPEVLDAVADVFGIGLGLLLVRPLVAGRLAYIETLVAGVRREA